MLTPHRLAALVFAAAIILWPVLFRSDFALGVGISIAGFALGTIGFVLLLGLAHQLAIGQAAFYMVGGYATGILTTRYGWDGLSAAAFGAVSAAVIAYVVGRPILKLEGFVLAIASFLLHLFFIALAICLVDFTGGSSGIPTVPRFSIGGWLVTSDLIFYAIAWLLVAAMLAVGQHIDRSRAGRALRALAANEPGAVACGIDTTRYKLQIFVVSAVMASLGGSILVHYLRVIDPTVFGLQFSLDIIVAVIIGGLYSVWGGVLGAATLTLVRELLRALDQPAWEVVIMGALTIIILISFPAGLAGAVSSLWNRFRRKAAALPTPAETPRASTPRKPASLDLLLRVENVSRSFGNLRAIDNVSFDIRPGEIIALIGPNGAGKTTMLDVISGHQSLDSGNIGFHATEIGSRMPDEIARGKIARTFQNIRLFNNLSVLENVMCGRHPFGHCNIATISMGLPAVAVEEDAIRRSAMQALADVGMAGAAELKPSQLSFGHQRMVELARASALEPELLLLDEPASGLNDTETEALADHILRIRANGTTVLLVEHDIRLVMGLADRIVVMNYGRKIAEGSPNDIRNNEDVIQAYLGVEA